MGIKRQLRALFFLVGLTLSIPAYGAILHTERTTTTLTKGAVHINDKLLTSEGWRNINILKIQLNESNVAVKPIEAANGVERKTVLDLATSNGAIAAINADYFDLSSSTTASLGTYIDQGILKYGYNSNYSTLGPNKNMATFTIYAQI